MTDRELLELAAKAAGIEIGWIDPVWNDPDATPYFHLPAGKLWNPLTDDGDALRLAVVLRITPHIDSNLTEAEWADQDRGGFIGEPHIDDPYAATRRAVTRAAAEIGRAMP